MAVRVLILEDDETLGKALSEAFKKQGHSVTLTADPDVASGYVANHEIDYFFVDCLLPKMPGVDVVDRIYENTPNAKFKLVLMSGIYTDKSYIQEATKRSHAVAFLKKPFELDEAVKLIRTEAPPATTDISPRKKLYSFFSKTNATNRDKRKTIEMLEEVSGYDLPIIYSLLSETKSSGHLNIYSVGKAVSGVTFSNGNIVGVDTEDKSTLLGEMLIQSGFVVPEDLMETLKDNNNKRRLGLKLVHNNLLSPHAFDVILQEQMNIRLSRTINDENVRINFATTDVELTLPCIEMDLLLDFLHDWIASKLNVNWLKNLYLMWAGHKIVKSSAFTEDHPILRMSLLSGLDGIYSHLQNGVTINQLLSLPDYKSQAIYKAIHFLVIKGLITFSKEMIFTNEAEQLRFLTKTYEELKEKSNEDLANYLEFSATATDSKEVFEEFQSILGPEPADKESDLFKVRRKLKSICESALLGKERTAFTTLTSVGRATGAATSGASTGTSGVPTNTGISYTNTGAKTGVKTKISSEMKIKAQAKIEQIKNLLQLNQYSKAYHVLQEVAAISTDFQNYFLFSSWAKLGLYSPEKKTVKLKDIEFDFMQIPPDEKYDPIYAFVNGLLCKVKEDFLGARKSFERALAIDPSLIVARREIGHIDNLMKQRNQDIFAKDLKDVVTGFFKRK